MLVCPLPCVLQELLTRQVALLYSLLCQPVHDLGLRGYRRMVGAWHPAGVLPLHACAAHQNVLNGVVQHVPHVQHAGDVWRRNHNRVRLAAVGLRAEEFVFQPVLIPFALHIGGIVLAC